MKSDYERKRYRNRYLLSVGIVLITELCFSLCIFSGQLWKILINTGILVVFAIYIYILSKREINYVYTEVEKVSDIIDHLLDDDCEPPVEEYREGTIGILYTNFHKLVKSLQESKNRALEEKIFMRDIISDISHQLKTPLASLTVFLDLFLEDKLEDEEKRKNVLNEAKNQLNRMEWMVLSMLKLARIEAGAISFEHQEHALESLLLQAADGVQFMLQKRKQTLNIDCGQEVMLLCDSGWLTEAVINLLKNASDYSDDGKNIWIIVEQTNVFMRIYIKDEGMGIAENELPNIFKRFYRVHQEVNPNSVGIGLSLTKSIVEGMGGSISVQSREGKGTCFILTFMK
ncbi:MAG: HAMP domain-containing histidine kinase [Lachnospiraceae bacterium]|nr:HAMP domain-containing histidine kinase [Lachnospiraceae bacterium]